MRKNIVDFVKGEKYGGVYICKSHSIKNAKTGAKYIDMQIVDKTGEINGKCWTIPQGFNPEKIVDGDFIALSLQIEEFQGKLQARIDNIKIIEPTDTFDKSEIIPMSPENPEKMFSEIMTSINDMQNEELQKLCANVIMENKEKLLVYPGAKTMHHAIVSGLLQHMTGMLRLGKTILSVYPSVNSDLLLAGIILHDICKPSEFELGPVGLCVDYTKKGKLIGHITMGVAYIQAKCAELKISEEIETLISHMILSHHGTPEFGSSVRPATLEAILLNMIDNIDAKVYMCEDALRSTEVGEFTEKIYGIDNVQIYNHGLKNNTQYQNY